MTAEAARAALRSDAYTVLVEAPAGTGKTYEAVDVALDLANALPDRREILLLAHTNAAVDEFRSRSRAAKAPVRATTFDALATELLAPYARTLGLGYPLRPQPEGSKIPGGPGSSATSTKTRARRSKSWLICSLRTERASATSATQCRPFTTSMGRCSSTGPR